VLVSAKPIKDTIAGNRTTRFIGVEEHHLESRQSRGKCDIGSHESSSHNSDLFHHHLARIRREPARNAGFLDWKKMQSPLTRSINSHRGHYARKIL
jgi:hypothetical protein